MILDKTSEKVLKAIINKCRSIVDQPIEVSPKELGVSDSLFNAIAEDLKQKELIASYYLCYDDRDIADVCLTYKGYSYFEYKRLELNERIKQSVALPIIVTLLTQFVLYLAKQIALNAPAIIEFLSKN